MRYTRFYTAILVVVMVLNICKYQMPYLEYNLFNDYIVENLCVQKDEVNNECQGHCFLQKQIKTVEETEHNTGNPTEKKGIGTDDYVVMEEKILHELTPLIKTQLSSIPDIHIAKMAMNIPTPPPQRFV